MATVTSSRNLSYHYTSRLGFKARTPALKHAGVGACSGCVARVQCSHIAKTINSKKLMPLPPSLSFFVSFVFSSLK